MAEPPNQPGNIFQGCPPAFESIDVDSPILSARAHACDYYADLYSAAAIAAENRGEPHISATYRFLQNIAGFCPRFDLPGSPYGPRWTEPGKRSPLPIDLNQTDVAALREIASRSQVAALKARLLDVVWLRTRDHQAGIEAVGYYLDAALDLDAEGQWNFSVQSFTRALSLGQTFGREKTGFKSGSDSIWKSLLKARQGSTINHCIALLRVLRRFNIGDSVAAVQLSGDLAKESYDRGDFEAAVNLWDFEVEWRRLLKDAEGEKRAMLAAAEAAVMESGAGDGVRGPFSFMTSSSLLSRAIERLRRAGAKKERVLELRRKLSEWQLLTRKEMARISTPPTDISQFIIKSRSMVHGLALTEAIKMLAFGTATSSPDAMKESVKNCAKEAPLLYLFGTTIVDELGRTILYKQGLLNLEGEAFEKALESEAFANASKFEWPLRVQAFIDPVRVEILNAHHPEFDDLAFLVRNNPFVPPGHEAIFIKGLHAGFHGDFITASHLLTPQIENSLRYVLESNGVDVSNLESDGRQPVKILGSLFDLPETEKIFGESYRFEMRGLLIEKTGYDFRNRVAHGFVSDGECFSPAAILTWWLVLRLCATPAFQQLEVNSTTIQDSESGGEPAQTGEE